MADERHKTESESGVTEKKYRFRLGLVLLISFVILAVSFCAYMMNTTLEEVLESETGSSVITHDTTFDTDSEK
ncbi:MAG: hypothetical protein IJ571_03485 [Ruminococcus sp.]|nr:hypothetical protein [Ruminococcus sp.]